MMRDKGDQAGAEKAAGAAAVGGPASGQAVAAQQRVQSFVQSRQAAESPAEAASSPSISKSSVSEPASGEVRGRSPVAATMQGSSKPTTEPDRGVSTDDAGGWSLTSLEDWLGARMLVYVGGVALALSGIFLFKFVAEQGMLEPPVRVSIGGLFGLGMIIAADLLRFKASRICQALSGAGIVTLLASLLAAVRLYELLPASLGFALMVVVIAAAVVLALRHGPFVAGLGLVGGFLTPALLRPEGDVGGEFFAYLIMLQVAVVYIARQRRWWPLIPMTSAAGLLWAIVAVAGGLPVSHTMWISMYIFVSAAATIVQFTMWRDTDKPQAEGTLLSLWMVIGWGVAAVLLLAVMIPRSSFQPEDFIMLALAGVGGMVLARINPRYLPVPCLSAAMSAIMLLAWGVNDWLRATPTTFDAARFIWLVLAFFAIHSLGSLAAMYRSAQSAAWAGLCVGNMLALMLLAMFILDDTLQHWFAWLDWWMPLAVLGAGCFTIVMTVIRDEQTWARYRMAMDILALGGAALLTLGITSGATLVDGTSVDYFWLPIGYGLLGVVMVAAAEQLKLIVLRYAVMWNLALAVIMLLMPAIHADTVRATAVFNGYLLQYGIPAGAMAFAAWRLHQLKLGILRDILQVLAVGVTLLMLVVLIHHGFHGQAFMHYDISISLVEWTTHVVSIMTLGMALSLLARMLANKPLTMTALIMFVAGLVVAVLVNLLIRNPVFTREPFGETLIFNPLLYTHGLPLLICIAAARLWQHGREKALAMATGIAGLLWLFMLVTLQVRHAFVGPVLSLRLHPISEAEQYTYSVAWIVLGALLLAAGMLTRNMMLRYASLLVMLLSVGKVFIFDSANLTGLLRVFSYAGLGFSLLILGYVYQRFVLKKTSEQRDK